MQENNVPKLAFTISEACRSIGISRSKLYELISTGRLRVNKIGSRTIIPAQSLYALIDDQD